MDSVALNMLSRSEIQKLAQVSEPANLQKNKTNHNALLTDWSRQREGIKANEKSKVIIEELLKKFPRGVPK